MIPLVKLLLIGLVAVAGFFGLSETFKFKGQEPVSETISVPEQIPVEEGKEWIKNIPLKAIWDMITAGTKEFITWLIKGVDLGIGTFLRFISPDMKIPTYFSWVIIGILLVFLFWKGLDAIYDWGHTFGKWALIIVIMIFAVFIVLMLLGKI